MAAYVLVDIEITDPVGYEGYRALAAPSVAEHGGRYLARGGATTVLEGERAPGRVVVLEFPDAEAARRWYDSPSYRAARAAREGCATGSFVLVDGTGA